MLSSCGKLPRLGGRPDDLCNPERKSMRGVLFSLVVVSAAA